MKMESCLRVVASAAIGRTRLWRRQCAGQLAPTGRLPRAAANWSRVNTDWRGDALQAVSVEPTQARMQPSYQQGGLIYHTVWLNWWWIPGGSPLPHLW